MEAIREEEFEEAAKLKQAIEEAASEDTVAEVLSQLKVLTLDSFGPS